MIEPSGVSRSASSAKLDAPAFVWERGLSDFRLSDNATLGPIRRAELAWAHDAEAAHSCIVRGRHGSTEGLLNLFQPGKKNARQHRHVPRCTRASSSVVYARHVGARHFGLAARMMRTSEPPH